VTELKYGPNTVEVEALIARFSTMTFRQAELLAASRDAAMSEEFFSAREAAMTAGGPEAFIVAWSRYATRDAAVDATEYAAEDSAWDAILALMVRDGITPEQFDILYQPWKQVMEGTMMVEDTDKPNSQADQIAAIIGRLEPMKVDEAKALCTAFGKVQGEALDAAWNEALAAAQGTVWSAAQGAVFDKACDEALDSSRCAILAILARDNITTEQFDILYGPWKQVMEDGR